MSSLRDFCIALLGGGALGAGGTIAVQQAPKPKPAVAKPAPKRTAPRKPAAPASRTPSPSLLADCPPAISWGSVGGLASIDIPSPLSSGSLPPNRGWHGGGGGWQQPPNRVPPPPTTTNPVPEPESWAILVTGFGMVAIALRRRRGEAGHGR